MKGKQTREGIQEREQRFGQNPAGLVTLANVQ